MKKIQSYVLSGILLLCFIVRGQDENNLFLLEGQTQWTNPSNTGLNGVSYLSFLIDSQWLGIKDAPKQQSVIFDSFSQSKKLNLGAIIRNRNRFGEQNIQTLLQSSFPVQINKKTRIQLGLQIMGDFFSSEYQYLRSVDGIQKDPLLQQQKRFVPNVGVGFSLVKNNFWIKGSVPRLLDPLMIRNKPTIFLRDQLHFFTEIGTQLSDEQPLYAVRISACLHNLAYDQLTLQLKGTLALRIGEVLVGLNSSKNLGTGFQFSLQDFFGVGYFLQFPIFTSTALNKTNHSLSLRFKIS